MKALRNNIVVEELANEKSNSMGLFLGKMMPDEVGRGKVLSIGEKVELPIKEGDIVQFKKSFATKTVVDGNEYFVIGQDMVLLNE